MAGLETDRLGVRRFIAAFDVRTRRALCSSAAAGTEAVARISKAATRSRTPKTRNLTLTEALPGHNPASQIGDADYDKKEFAYDLAGRVEVATDQKDSFPAISDYLASFPRRACPGRYHDWSATGRIHPNRPPLAQPPPKAAAVPRGDWGAGGRL